MPFLSAPALVLFVGLLFGPIVWLVRVSLYESKENAGFFEPGTWSLANFEVVLDSHGRELLGFTVILALLVAALSLLAAFPLALFIHSLSHRSRRVAIVVVLLPKLASVLVVLFGLQQILSSSGPVSTLLVALAITPEPIALSRSLYATALGEAYLVCPYAVLVVLIQLLRIDPALAIAARGLGAGHWVILRRITLPLCLPGLILAFELSLMWGMGAFLGPMFLGGPEQMTISIEIHRQAFEYSRWPRAAAGAVVLLVSTILCLSILNVLVRFGRRWI